MLYEVKVTNVGDLRHGVSSYTGEEFNNRDIVVAFAEEQQTQGAQPVVMNFIVQLNRENAINPPFEQGDVILIDLVFMMRQSNGRFFQNIMGRWCQLKQKGGEIPVYVNTMQQEGITMQ